MTGLQVYRNGDLLGKHTGLSAALVDFASLGLGLTIALGEMAGRPLQRPR